MKPTPNGDYNIVALCNPPSEAENLFYLVREPPITKTKIYKIIQMAK